MKSILWKLTILAAVSGLVVAGEIASAADREAMPASPVNYGAGLSLGHPDMEGPYVPGTAQDENAKRDARIHSSLMRGLKAEKSIEDDVGGDDVVISTDALNRTCDIAIASTGDIYVALEWGDFAGDGMEIRTYRSQDGGDSWQAWGVFPSPVPYADLEDPCLHIAEGSVQRCYLAYRVWTSVDGSKIRVGYSDLSATNGSWTVVTAIDIPDVSVSRPSLTSDASTFDAFFLYLVADGNDGAGRDIYFSRSLDLGNTYETPYKIAELTLDDRGYHAPSIAYGINGYVHVAWHFGHNTDAMDDAIRYRRAADWAGAGLAAWDPVQYLTSNADDIWDDFVTIAASLISNDVMIVHRRYINGNLSGDPGQLVSHDQGTSFPEGVVISGGLIHPSSLDQAPGTGTWVMGGGASYPWGPGLQRASAAAPTVWSAEEQFVDDASESGTIWGATTALDPTHGDRAAAAWVDLMVDVSDPNELKFDAEWRRDPGYPNLMAGYPLDLDHAPLSPPALVDLDGNGTLEIVYGDDNGRIQAWNHDGVPLSGYPIDTGHPLSDGPVAVGALAPGGRLFVVAGTADGWVVAYNADGTVADGWPEDLSSTAPVYVSLGALGPPSLRTVVICYANRLTYRDYRGSGIEGFYGRLYSLDTLLTTPAAIGDIDGDGVNDVVVGPGNTVRAYDPRSTSTKMYRSLSSEVSDQITLGDLDLDGEVEVFVPTQNGTLYALQEDGTDYNTAFPFVSSTGSPLTSAVLGNCLSTYEPEIAVAARDWTVHLLYGHSGEETPWSPTRTGAGWYLLGAPVIGRIDGSVTDVVIGDRSTQVWAWDNVGRDIPGWPRTTDNRCQLSPALGDLDGDGLTEAVFLTLDQVVVYELNQGPASDHNTWLMYGHDPRRTGCADCPEDLVTPVADDGAAFTRVSFSQPSPNPMSASGTFRFAVPIRAAASLEIFDLRGRRLRTILREEVELGERIVTWDGRDGSGRELAAGQYLARLRVRGPGLDEELIRKVTVLK